MALNLSQTSVANFFGIFLANLFKIWKFFEQIQVILAKNTGRRHEDDVRNLRGDDLYIRTTNDLDILVDDDEYILDVANMYRGF